MSRSRHERDYERGRGREYEVDRDREREKDRDRYRPRDRDRGRERSRERERERGTERGRSRDMEREKEKLREVSKDRYERGGSRERDGNGRHHKRDRRGDAEMRPGKSSRSRSPMAEPKGDRGSRPARMMDSDRDMTMSPRQVADAAANENATEVARNQSDDDAVDKMEAAKAALEAKEKEKAQPTFEYSGKLAAETNKVRGVTLAFVEPPEARKPSTRWRLYVFKDGEPLNEPLYIHRQTCYLFGRERRVADVPTDHPSCSKQHAVIQYRVEDIPDYLVSWTWI